MMSLFKIAAGLLFLVQAERDADLVRVIGGRVQELSAVLQLDEAGQADLGKFFDAAKAEIDEFRAKVKEKGAASAAGEYAKWRDGVRGRFRATLKPDQQKLYDGYLARKARLDGAFEKALFGIPPPVELKLRLGLNDKEIEPLARASDEGVRAIRDKLAALRKDGAADQDLARAVNDLRRSAIEKMIGSVRGSLQTKVRQYVKKYLRTPFDKLSGVDRALLDRTLRNLKIKDRQRASGAKRLLSAILMHRAENTLLRHGMGKDLLVILLTHRREAELWIRMNEYEALIRIHDRRLEDLYGDAKSLFTSTEIARLVAEGMIK